jgi:uncharacterized protein (DUF2236 family)
MSPSSEVESPVSAISWKLQREIVLLGAWAPAILLQFAHPLVARGIADHSRFQDGRRLHRFYRTVQAMLHLCFGSDDEARAAARGINAIHDRVHGHLREPAGIFPAGTPYSARDPALLAWVHATLLVMNLRVYERYVARLAPEEKDRYCAEATVIERYLDIPAGRLPRTVSELDDYMDTMLSTGVIAVTDVARALAHSVLFPPAPRVARPMLALVRLVTLDLLPPAIRDAYGFAWNDRREAMARASARVVRAVLPVTPPVLRYWPAARRATMALPARS